MNQNEQQKPDLRRDSILLIRLVVFGIFSLAVPFTYLWVRLGCIGKRAFDFTHFVGLAFFFPMFGQWPHDATDLRIFLRSWELLWGAAFVQRIAAAILNRRLGIHTHEIGSRGWIGRNPLWPVFIVSPLAYLFVEPVCFGLGRYLTVAPFAYFLGHVIVNWKHDREAEEIFNARIAAGDLQRRI